MTETQPSGRFEPPEILKKVRAMRTTYASFGKLALILVLMGLLLIPMGQVRDLITEREKRRGEAQEEVAGKWGGNQTLGGIVLTVPYRFKAVIDSNRTDTLIRHAHFLPEELDVLGALVPEVRHRGLFEVPLFQADLEIRGRFAQPAFATLKVKPEDVLWDEAYVTLGIPELRSVADAPPLEWQGRPRALAPENLEGTPVDAGLQARVPLAHAPMDGEGYAFRAKLKLNGSGSMMFLPMGKQTRITVRSPWTTPSFGGAYLPEQRSVNASGFQADWRTLHLSRNFPQSWTGDAFGPKEWEPYAYGVELLLPVDRYLKAERCAKYAALFIVLTFLVFFLYETFDRIRIHPLQYLLVGAALCLFYLLLLSLSEHVAFPLAYAAATAGVVGLITAYSSAILATRKRALGLGGMLTGLYAYLYTLLQMEDYALLMGSIGLFVILAAVMFATRRLNWYGSKDAKPTGPAVAGATA